MFPLRDLHKPAHPPFVTRLLVTLNVTVFLYELFCRLAGAPDNLLAGLGVVPRCYLSPSACGIDAVQHSDLLWKPLFGALFLHGGILHLAFNMLFLWVFGPAVEDRLGKFRFALAYFGCGMVASLAHIATHPFSTVPVIGASGAISGVLGLYLILLPRSWILTYFPPIFLFPVPAPLFLIGWILLQVVSAFNHLPGLWAHPAATDVAWVAHIGGFAAGAAMGWSINPWWKPRNRDDG